MCVDLHIHSIYSDGTAYPADLVQMAVQAGLKAISLTDHDTVDGIGEILACAENRLTVVPGLEISAQHRKHSMHILGYGIDHQNRNLRNWLFSLQEGRIERNREILHKLQKLGLEVTDEELQKISQTGQTGRPHIARLLVRKRVVKTTEDAFRLYLRKGAPAWASRLAYSAAESIQVIHESGGIAVLAHPGLIQTAGTTMPLLIAELVERGLDGLEVYYPGHSDKTRKDLLRLAKKYTLVVTGGSDYHGNVKKYAKMADTKNGFCPPDEILDQLLNTLKTVRSRYKYRLKHEA